MTYNLIFTEHDNLRSEKILVSAIIIVLRFWKRITCIRSFERKSLPLAWIRQTSPRNRNSRKLQLIRGYRFCFLDCQNYAAHYHRTCCVRDGCTQTAIIFVRFSLPKHVDSFRHFRWKLFIIVSDDVCEDRSYYVIRNICMRNKFIWKECNCNLKLANLKLPTKND